MYCATQHGPVEDHNLRQRQRSRSRARVRAREFPMALNYDADVDIPMPALDLEDWRGVRKHWTLEEEIDLMRSVAGDQVDDGQGQDEHGQGQDVGDDSDMIEHFAMSWGCPVAEAQHAISEEQVSK